jgi:hypothetical protein
MLIDLLQQVPQQSGHPRQRLITDDDRVAACHRLPGDLHQVDDRERPVAKVDVAADRVEAI